MGVKFLPSRLNSGSLFQVGPSSGWLVALLILVPLAVEAQPRYANKLAPYVVSPQRVVDRMLEMASVKPGEMVYDLGCGDGRVLITAVQRFGARAIGIEINDKLVQRATERVSALNLQDKIRIVHGDLAKADISDADVVIMYLLTDSNEQIRPRLEKILKPGSRVISYSYAVPGWKPALVDKTDGREGHFIYLYEMPAAQGK